MGGPIGDSGEPGALRYGSWLGAVGCVEGRLSHFDGGARVVGALQTSGQRVDGRSAGVSQDARVRSVVGCVASSGAYGRRLSAAQCGGKPCCVEFA